MNVIEDVVDDGDTTDVPVEVLAAYLKWHVRTPQFTERWEFGPDGDTGPRPPDPKPEFLLQSADRLFWHVRWPNGTIKWESEASLVRRAIRIPAEPLLTGDMTPADAALLEPGVVGVTTIHQQF